MFINQQKHFIYSQKSADQWASSSYSSDFPLSSYSDFTVGNLIRAYFHLRSDRVQLKHSDLCQVPQPHTIRLISNRNPQIQSVKDENSPHISTRSSLSFLPVSPVKPGPGLRCVKCVGPRSDSGWQAVRLCSCVQGLRAVLWTGTHPWLSAATVAAG